MKVIIKGKLGGGFTVTVTETVTEPAKLVAVNE